MDIKKYIENLNKKVDEFDKKAKNPFLENDFAYNPFKGAFEQTYIWIESKNKKESRH